MTLYDATLPICENMLIFPGDPAFKSHPASEIRAGDEVNLSLISFGTHLGTHVDAPRHYLEGAAGMDEIPLNALIGDGIILDMRDKKVVTRRDLEKSALGDHRRVLLKTDSGPALRSSTFVEDYVYLSEDGAEFLVEKGILLVGIDYLSIEKYENPGGPVHKTLLGAGMVIVEGALLMDVPAGPCRIYCLPLAIRGADGSPARLIIESAMSRMGHNEG